MFFKTINFQIIFIFCFAINLSVFSQNETKTENKKPIAVTTANGESLKFPWTGGMNSCQFGEIDMNDDGIKDLFVFDRNGNRIMTFINKGTQNTVDYEFAPEYINCFPELFDWAILADYNMDGKNDIFTYSPGYASAKVYKNISKSGELAFRLVVSPYLTSYQGGGYVNILITYVDYPAISDIDNDGDLDILTFWGLGSFVQMHKNLSMEKYGNADSLDYELTTHCWGRFAENNESNIIYLDTCFMKSNNIMNKGERHTGSTFLSIDLDNDSDKDLILGDIDYPNVIELTNGGTSEEALMISQDTAFPNTHSLRIFSVPALNYFDVDNDGISDLLASPFDPSLVTSENYNSSWFYKNTGSNEIPDFSFQTKQFLQEEMIDLGSGAYPVFFDYNKDGLSDLFVGNFGYYDHSSYNYWMFLTSYYISQIAYFENTGTAENPQFTLLDRDFCNISDLELISAIPTFGDVDGDGSDDMILGNKEGNLFFYKNQNPPNQKCSFELNDTNFQNIDVGDFSSPQIIDLDDDLLNDLVIGEKGGNLNYFKNIGTISNPVFTSVTDSLGKVNVTDYSISYDGYSVPYFFKDKDDKFKLIVGSEQGKIHYFKNIEGNLQNEFTESYSLAFLVDTIQFELYNGIRTGATIQDLDNDGYFELIAGNFSGGMNYYTRKDKAVVNIGINELQNIIKNNVNIVPNPADKSFAIQFSEFPKNLIITFSVFNIIGETTILNKDITSLNTKIKTNDYPNGIYFCKISFLDYEKKSSFYLNKKIIIRH
ncbi:MAG: T9SS type A sorting domain-containing protein [Bacteroidales bacterium]|nr:T9SS type A sorting domain-containing protein [Bacteroidales bacterium]